MRPLTLILLSAAFVGCGGESSPGAARAPAGPVDASRGGYGMMVGWGAEVDGRWLGGQARSGIHALRAVAADETSLDELMGNRIGDLLLTLELTDVTWVAKQVAGLP